MEAETTIPNANERTVDELLAEARKLRKLCDGYEPRPVVDYALAVVDLARVSAARIEQLATRIAAAVDCAEGHTALKHGTREAFEAATTPIGATDGPRAMPLGNCRRCASTIAYVGGGA